MIFEDILGEYKKEEPTDELTKCPECGSDEIGTREVGGTRIGFFCINCKHEWMVKKDF